MKRRDFFGSLCALVPFSFIRRAKEKEKLPEEYEWIRVKDELPPANEWIWGAFDDGRVHETRYKCERVKKPWFFTPGLFVEIPKEGFCDRPPMYWRTK